MPILHPRRIHILTGLGLKLQICDFFSAIFLLFLNIFLLVSCFVLIVNIFNAFYAT